MASSCSRNGPPGTAAIVSRSLRCEPCALCINWRHGSLSVNASIAGAFAPCGIASSTDTA